MFVFGRDEPEDRATTRAGGTPYWPKAKPWPVCKGCSLKRPHPMQFVAQLDFRKSRLRASVPGDVLAFHYCPSCRPGSSAHTENMAETELIRRHYGLSVPALPETYAYVPGGGALTWSIVKPSGPALLSASEVAELERRGGDEIGPFYGTPRAAMDYPTPDAAYGDGIAGEGYTYLHFTLQGTKIGGYPPPIQQFRVPVDSTGRPMRFLGTLGSLTSASVDGDTRSGAGGDFLWGDMGSLYLWISEARLSPQMAWFWLCY